MISRLTLTIRQRYWVPFGLGTLLFGLGTGTVFARTFLGIVLIILGGLFGVFGALARESVSREGADTAVQLEGARLKCIEYAVALDASLVGLGSALTFWLRDCLLSVGLADDARVTVYWRTESVWLRISRFSQNLTYMQSGRKTISLGEGLVKIAHARGEFVVANLPDRLTCLDVYLEEQKKLGLSKKVAQKLSMQSRSYAAFAFGRDTLSPRQIMMVFESTDPNGLDADVLRASISEDFQRLAFHLVNTHNVVRESRPG